MGRGPMPGKLMAIGEAPGKREDDVGKPFQGAAGKVLDDLFDDAQVKRKDVYITNAVKCRPPQNRTPSAKEVKACRPYLEWEYQQVQPQKVLLLGATALKTIKRSGIGENRGQIIEQDGREYMVTFHPAAALHDPTRMQPLIRDMKKYGDWTRGEVKTEKEVPYHFVRSYDDFMKFVGRFASATAFSFDLETTSLKWWKPGEKVNTIQIGLDDGQTWVIPLNVPDHPDFPNPFQGRLKLQKAMLRTLVVLQRENRIKCTAWNGKFDNLWLRKHYRLHFYLDFDAMLAHHLLDENRNHDLKNAAADECNAPDFDVPLKVKLFKDWERFKDAYNYAAADGYWEIKVYEALRAKLLKQRSLRRLYQRVVMRAARMFEDIEQNGLYLNVERMREVRDELNRQKADLIKRMNGIAGREVKWTSDPQVRQLLFVDLGLPSLLKTDGGEDSTAETVLLQLQDKHPIPKLLIELRGLNKNLSTYVGVGEGEKGWEALRVGNYIHLSTKLHGTVTGRYSSRLHQVPRDPLIRSMVDAPPGWTFVQADYSQIELRLAAHASGDRRMKLVFQTGGDIHATTASEITGKDPKELTKEERKQGKPVNFGFVYGMGARKFRVYARDNYGVNFTDRQSNQYRRRFFELYNGLPDWHDRMRKVVRAYGQVESLSGRVRRLPGIYSDDDGVKAEAERQAINSPIQGFGSGDLKAMGMVEMHEKFQNPEWLEQNVFPMKHGAFSVAQLPVHPYRRTPDVVRIVGEVHDSVLMWVRTEHLESILPHVRKIMERPELFDEFEIDLSVPIVVDVETGAWGSGKKWDEGRQHTV